MRFSYPKINVKIKIFVVNLLQMLLKVSIFVVELSIAIIFNGSQLKNSDISGAIFTLNLSILILNSQCVEDARDVRAL